MNNKTRKRCFICKRYLSVENSSHFIGRRISTKNIVTIRICKLHDLIYLQGGEKNLPLKSNGDHKGDALYDAIAKSNTEQSIQAVKDRMK